MDNQKLIEWLEAKIEKERAEIKKLAPYDSWALLHEGKIKAYQSVIDRIMTDIIRGGDGK